MAFSKVNRFPRRMVGLTWGVMAEGSPGIGFALLNANATGSGVVVSGWAVLRYCREMGISKDEAISGMVGIVDTIKEMPENWLVEHNKRVIIVKVFSVEPTVTEMLSVAWKLAWQQVESEHFQYPVLHMPKVGITL